MAGTEVTKKAISLSLRGLAGSKKRTRRPIKTSISGLWVSLRKPVQKKSVQPTENWQDSTIQTRTRVAKKLLKSSVR